MTTQPPIPPDPTSPSQPPPGGRGGFTVRSPAMVLLLPFVTLGIYLIVWYFQTSEEMRVRGRDIPTTWLILVPIVNWWWLWKYSEAVEQSTNRATETITAFLLLWFLGCIGAAVIQDRFNRVSG